MFIYQRDPEGKPSLSYSFPMNFPWKPEDTQVTLLCLGRPGISVTEAVLDIWSPFSIITLRIMDWDRVTGYFDGKKISGEFLAQMPHGAGIFTYKTGQFWG